jgi:hypothetical protein
VVRHGLRSLVKKGHPGALAALGFGPPQVELIAFELGRNRVAVGESLPIRLAIRSTAGTDQKLVIDYAMHHQKANGSLSPKVFKWRTRSLAAWQTLELDKAHSLRPVTTRRYHLGPHRVEVLINGRSFGALEFSLVSPAP